MRLTSNFIFISVIAACLLLTSCNQPADKNQGLVVQTSYGKVSGYSEDSISVFKGIPYAKAERFMPPQSPDSWEGVRECITYGPVAKQVVPWINDSLMNEKELFNLNVWTPGIADGRKRPVMVWLH